MKLKLSQSLKFYGGLVILALGILLILHGINSLHPILVEAPKGIWEKTTDFFTHNPMWNPVIKFFGGTPIPEPLPPSRYNPAAIARIVIGSLIFLYGASVTYRFKRSS